MAQASPATVSRCGMVYIDPDELGYLPYVRTWLDESMEKNLFNQENSEFLYELFKMAAVGVQHVNTNCQVGIKQVDILWRKQRLFRFWNMLATRTCSVFHTRSCNPVAFGLFLPILFTHKEDIFPCKRG